MPRLAEAVDECVMLSSNMSPQTMMAKPELGTSPEVAPMTMSGRVEVRSAPPWPERIRKVLLFFALSVVSYLVISQFFLQSVMVVGRSMTPTLKDSQHYLLNRWVYRMRAPELGEVVVLKDLLDNTCAVKRIVAGPGDTVELKSGKVYRNGQPLQESYLPVGTPTFVNPDSNQQVFQCGKEQYFVLGDNRNNSIDSRAYGPVPRDHILGQLMN
jgi:signal peptidase I